MTSTALVTTRRNVPLIAARALAGTVGATQVAGAVFFLLIAPEEAVWHGPWVDAPVIAVLLTGVFLKLAFALAPGMDAARRIGLGLLAVGIGIGITLVKIPVYDEPESATLIAVDAVLGGLLLLARRGTRRA
jgi:hypothetical protein